MNKLNMFDRTLESAARTRMIHILSNQIEEHGIASKDMLWLEGFAGECMRNGRVPLILLPTWEQFFAIASDIERDGCDAALDMLL